MAIKLFNKTPYDDKVLQQLLSFAQRAMGLKGTTVVKVTCNQLMYCSGVAHDGKPYLWHLKSKRVPESRRYTIPKGIDSGYVELKIPHPRVLVPGFTKDIAERVLSVAFHEFAHIKDYRDSLWDRQFLGYGKSGRRVAWKKRPMEISAEDQKDDALKKIQRNPRKDVFLKELIAEFEARAIEARTLPDKALEILKTLASDDSAQIGDKQIKGRFAVYSLKTRDSSVPISRKIFNLLRHEGYVCFKFVPDPIPVITEKGRRAAKEMAEAIPATS